MSQFGVFMLMAALTLGMVGLIKFLAWLTELQEQGGIGAAAKRGIDRYVDRRGGVKPLAPQERPVAPPRVMSLEVKPPTHTSSIPVYTTDDLVGVAAKLTYAQKIAVLAAMLDDDKKPYSANKIVAFLGGDRNGVLAALREARPASETAVEPAYTTPIAGRPTAAQFDPDLAYQPPPR